MPSPVIGLTLRPHAANGGPATLLRNRAYFDALEDAGGAVMPLPVTTNVDHLRALYKRCDALCMPGGPDVSPRLYGEEPQPECAVDTDTALDGLERQLFTWALADDMPVLAICRGMQLLNVVLGGTLWQDLVTQREGVLQHQHEVSHRDVMHDISITSTSRLSELAGATSVLANSRHHQAVRSPAAGLTVTAESPDGVVEGVEDASRRFLIGVQCHPEDLYAGQEWSRRLFRSFVVAAAPGA